MTGLPADGLTSHGPSADLLPRGVRLTIKWAGTVAKTQLSKADKIRKLLHLPNGVIAERTGFAINYVQHVRLRTSPSGNPIQLPIDIERDRRCKVARYRTDPEFAERKRAIQRRYDAKRRAEARAS
jgi:hypothetical protein